MVDLLLPVKNYAYSAAFTIWRRHNMRARNIKAELCIFSIECLGSETTTNTTNNIKLQIEQMEMTRAKKKAVFLF